jgi:hypothetical protein
MELCGKTLGGSLDNQPYLLQIWDHHVVILPSWIDCDGPHHSCRPGEGLVWGGQACMTCGLGAQVTTHLLPTRSLALLHLLGVRSYLLVDLVLVN